ncbi:MAG: hypothetical protein CVV06_02880 [Gammaproteobacteria bacterium HGW-Gammaproteobacteria-10]|nr:MAG: hypothetical protein CVV06_02880 [Gammaproteobacteria bacterium HGW-Gammaproteobacteria-10]
MAIEYSTVKYRMINPTIPNLKIRKSMEGVTNFAPAKIHKGKKERFHLLPSSVFSGKTEDFVDIYRYYSLLIEKPSKNKRYGVYL